MVVIDSFEGIDKYQDNVDMLAGRTTLGSILFEDASIVLHNTIQLKENILQTRWTLQVTVKALPWRPRAKFTGVSVYTLDGGGKISKQDDYWDSINLSNGKYQKVGLGEGLSDFWNQVKAKSNAEMAAPELPFELLRRAKTYEVRRYPSTVVAETLYDQRPEGYDRIGEL